MREPEEIEALEEEKFLEANPQERVFRDILLEAKNYQSYHDPPQLTFELSN